MLNKILDKIAAYANANPAVVSYLVTMAVAAAAKWGLHLDPAQIASVVAVVMTLAHAWLHTQTRAIQAVVVQPKQPEQPKPDLPAGA